MDSQITAILTTGIISLIPISIVFVVKISNYKLRMEQIKAETVLKTEEIRARNRLDIEKLMVQDSQQSTNEKTSRNSGIFEDENLSYGKSKNDKNNAF